MVGWCFDGFALGDGREKGKGGAGGEMFDELGVVDGMCGFMMGWGMGNGEWGVFSLGREREREIRGWGDDGLLRQGPDGKSTGNVGNSWAFWVENLRLYDRFCKFYVSNVTVIYHGNIERSWFHGFDSDTEPVIGFARN